MPNQDQPINTNPVPLPISPVQNPSPVVPTEPSTDSFDAPPPPIVVSDTQPEGFFSEAGTSPASVQPLPETPVTGTDQVLPPLNVSPVVVTGGSGGALGKKMGRKGLVATILGLLLLVGGVGAGLYLTGQKQDIREEAAVGDVAEPTATPTPLSTQYKCKEVRAYKVTADVTDPANWTLLTVTGLKTLKEDDVVYFTVLGTSTDTITANGGFDKGEFTINSGTPIESTNVKPKATTDTTNNVEFYYQYTVPADRVNFDIKGRLHHVTAGWM